MFARYLSLLTVCALLPALASAAPLTLELRADALVGRARIVLADVARVDANNAALSALELGNAPRIGYVERITRAQIAHALRRQSGVDAIEWSGADSVAVRVQSQTIKATDLANAAIDFVRRSFGAAHPGLQVSIVHQPADLDVPAGVVELRARRAAGAVLAARMPQWVDLVVDGAVYRSALVQLNVAAPQKAYLARRPMEQGAWVSAADFTVADANVVGVHAVAVGAPLAPFRLRQPVKAGQLLSTQAMLGGGQILRGDQVKLVVHSGQIGIETGAVAMAEAGPGQMLAVRPAGGSDIVTGRVSQSGTVIIE